MAKKLTKKMEAKLRSGNVAKNVWINAAMNYIIPEDLIRENLKVMSKKDWYEYQHHFWSEDFENEFDPDHTLAIEHIQPYQLKKEYGLDSIHCFDDPSYLERFYQYKRDELINSVTIQVIWAYEELEEKNHTEEYKVFKKFIEEKTLDEETIKRVNKESYMDDRWNDTYSFCSILDYMNCINKKQPHLININNQLMVFNWLKNNGKHFKKAIKRAASNVKSHGLNAKGLRVYKKLKELANI